MTTETAQDGLGVEARRVKLDELHLDIDNFQFRHLPFRSDHVDDLVEAIKRVRYLDPLTVWERPEDGCLFVVEGHHRFEAYKRSGKVQAVPVIVHRCGFDDAQLLALEDNTKVRLPMTNDEKMDAAWRLVAKDMHKDDGAYTYTRKQIIQATGASRSTIANMRNVMQTLKRMDEDAPASWGHAQMLARGADTEWTDEDREAWDDKHRTKLKEVLASHAVYLLSRRPSLIIEAAEEFMGQQLFKDCMDAHGYTLVNADDEDPDFPF